MLTDPEAEDDLNQEVLDELVRVRKAIGGLAGALKPRPVEPPIVNVPAPIVNLKSPEIIIPARAPWAGEIDVVRDSEGRVSKYVCIPSK